MRSYWGIIGIICVAVIAAGFLALPASAEKQYTNLAELPEHAEVLNKFKKKFAAKMKELRDNDLKNG